jgi:hypothetical protein
MTFEPLLGIAIIGAVLWWIYSKIQKKVSFYDLPKDGPMKVNIGTKYEKHPLSQTSHYLVIDVQISQADWAAIKQSGLANHTLMQYRSSASRPGDPEGWLNCQVKDLDRKIRIGYNDIQQLETAKAELIEALRNLRVSLDQYREGPKSEQLEI